MMVGGALANGLSMLESIKAALLGSLLLTIYASLVGSIGAKTGMTTTTLLREVFGSHGSKLLALVLAVCLCGWYAVQVDFFGQTISHLFPNGGLLVSPKVASLWGGLLMMTSALFGYRGLAALSILAIPLITILASYGLYESIKTDIWTVAPSLPQSFGNAVSLVVGSFAIGATVNADITRYARGIRASVVATSIGFFAANVFILVCGAASTLATGSSDLIAGMVAIGLGSAALCVLILGQWTTNDNNLYYATTNISEAFPALPKGVLVGVFGLTATLLGVAGVTSAFVPFLVWLGFLIPPIGGIMITHYLVLGRKCSGSQKARAACAFVAWISGSLAGAYSNFGIPALNSVLVAMAIFAVLACTNRRHNSMS
jgi:cytosine permease